MADEFIYGHLIMVKMMKMMMMMMMIQLSDDIFSTNEDIIWKPPDIIIDGWWLIGYRGYTNILAGLLGLWSDPFSIRGFSSQTGGFFTNRTVDDSPKRHVSDSLR